jgi:hypothetical protein
MRILELFRKFNEFGPLIAKFMAPEVWAAIKLLLDVFNKLQTEEQRFAFASQVENQVMGLCGSSSSDVVPFTPEVETALIAAGAPLAACCDEENCGH